MEQCELKLSQTRTRAKQIKENVTWVRKGRGWVTYVELDIVKKRMVTRQGGNVPLKGLVANGNLKGLVASGNDLW